MISGAVRGEKLLIRGEKLLIGGEKLHFGGEKLQMRGGSKSRSLIYWPVGHEKLQMRGKKLHFRGEKLQMRGEKLHFRGDPSNSSFFHCLCAILPAEANMNTTLQISSLETPKRESDLIVRQSNAFISMPSPWRFYERRVFLALAANLSPYSWPRSEISGEVLRELYGMSANNKSFESLLRESAVRLASIKWVVPTSIDSWVTSGLLVSISWDARRGKLIGIFEEGMRDHLLSIPKSMGGYTQYHWYHSVNLVNTYGIALFQQCAAVAYRPKNQWRVSFAFSEETLAEMKEAHPNTEYTLARAFGYTPSASYESIGNVKNRIIKPAIKDLAENSSVIVIDSVEYVKGMNRSGRKPVIGVIFHFNAERELLEALPYTIKEKQLQRQLFVEDAIEQTESVQVNLVETVELIFREMQIDVDVLNELIAEFGIGHVHERANIAMDTITDRTGDNLNNPAGFLLATIRKAK